MASGSEFIVPLDWRQNGELTGWRKPSGFTGRVMLSLHRSLASSPLEDLLGLPNRSKFESVHR